MLQVALLREEEVSVKELQQHQHYTDACSKELAKVLSFHFRCPDSMGHLVLDVSHHCLEDSVVVIIVVVDIITNIIIVTGDGHHF